MSEFQAELMALAKRLCSVGYAAGKEADTIALAMLTYRVKPDEVDYATLGGASTTDSGLKHWLWAHDVMCSLEKTTVK